MKKLYIGNNDTHFKDESIQLTLGLDYFYFFNNGVLNY